MSVILGLVGEDPDRVSAHGGNYLHDQIADVTVTHLDFPSGVKAHVFVSWLHPFKEQKLVVVGDRRMAVFDDRADDKLVVFPHKIEWESLVPKVHRAEAEVVPIEAAEPLQMECQHFLDCVAGRVTPRTDGAEGLRVLRLLRVAQESLEKGGVPHAGSTTEIDTGSPYQVHESSYVDADVEIGDGTTIWHFSHLMSGSRLGRACRIGQNVVIGPRVRLGDGVKIQNNVSVYEGVELEDAVFCGPSMVFTNVYNPRSEISRMDDIRRTLVRRGASLGANCTVVCGVTIGEYAFVGAGAVVNRDVPDYALVVGNPGKVIGWMCVCGLQLDFNSGDRSTCEGCGIMYTKLDDAVHPVSLDSAKTLTAK